MSRRCLPLLLIVLGLFGVDAHAYTRLAAGTGTEPVYEHWSTLPVGFRVNDQTTDTLPQVREGSDPLQAVLRAFQTWESVPTSAIRFAYGGPTSVTTMGYDGTNLVTFADSSFAFNGALAVTLRFRYVSTGEVVDADIAFNPAYDWSTRGAESGVYDVQQVAAHEIGHFSGLGHSGVVSATMFPYAGSASQLGRRLDSDDEAGISDVYPAPAMAGRAALEGYVTRMGGAVFGAQVVAVDEVGCPGATALTTKTGYYHLAGLRPGSYDVRVEPLDGPTSQANLNSYWASAPFVTDFPAVVAPAPVALTAGQTARHDIAVNGYAPSFTVDSIGLQPSSGGGFSLSSLPRTVLQGAGTQWRVALAGSGLTSPATFEVLGVGVTRVGAFSYMDLGGDRGLVLATVDITADAPPGPRVLSVEIAGERGLLTGALEVLPNPATLELMPDPLYPGRLLLSWHGGTPPYRLLRDSRPELDIPAVLLEDTDLQFSDLLPDEGIDYFYRLEEP